MSAAVTIAVDTTDAKAKTLPPSAPSIRFPDPFSMAAKATLTACCDAVDDDESNLPLEEYNTDNFRPGRVVSREYRWSEKPTFVVFLDGEMVGGWRGPTGWIVGVAEGEVRCEECDDFLHSSDMGENDERIVCKRCAHSMALADEGM